MCDMQQFDRLNITIDGGNGLLSCSRSDIGNKFSLNDVSDTIDFICPDIDTICLTEQPFQCWNGYYNSTMDTCVCSVGYKGSQCQNRDDDIIDEDIEISDDSFDFPDCM